MIILHKMWARKWKKIQSVMLISHASKVMFKIFQAKLQQYVKLVCVAKISVDLLSKIHAFIYF